YYNPYYAPYAYAYPAPYPAPAYGDPYAYPPPNYPSYPASTYPAPAYPPAPGSIGVQGPNQQASTGGLSFEITPGDAQVFVDGSYVGTVGQFTPTSQPLGLMPCRHRVEIISSHMCIMAFNDYIVHSHII